MVGVARIVSVVTERKPRMLSVASVICSIWAVIIEKYRSPASVSVTLRPVRAISVVPSWPSSNWICWETAEGVTLSSSAAREMLPALAAA